MLILVGLKDGGIRRAMSILNLLVGLLFCFVFGAQCVLWVCADLLCEIKDFQTSLEMKAIQGYDVVHQLWKLRHGKNLSDAEVELIMRALVESVQTYEQVVEVFILRMLLYSWRFIE